jgi:hypothetical protein
MNKLKLVVGNVVHCPLRFLIAWKAALILFIGAILGVLYLALKATSKGPVDALAWE